MNIPSVWMQVNKRSEKGFEKESNASKTNAKGKDCFRNQSIEVNIEIWNGFELYDLDIIRNRYRYLKSRKMWYCPTKRYVFKYFGFEFDDFMIQPLGFCFLSIDWGRGRHLVVVWIEPRKGDAGEIFRKFKELEKFSTFGKFLLTKLDFRL